MSLIYNFIKRELHAESESLFAKYIFNSRKSHDSREKDKIVIICEACKSRKQKNVNEPHVTNTSETVKIFLAYSATHVWLMFLPDCLFKGIVRQKISWVVLVSIDRYCSNVGRWTFFLNFLLTVSLILKKTLCRHFRPND